MNKLCWHTQLCLCCTCHIYVKWTHLESILVQNVSCHTVMHVASVTHETLLDIFGINSYPKCVLTYRTLSYSSVKQKWTYLESILVQNVSCHTVMYVAVSHMRRYWTYLESILVQNVSWHTALSVIYSSSVPQHRERVYCLVIYVAVWTYLESILVQNVSRHTVHSLSYNSVPQHTERECTV